MARPVYTDLQEQGVSGGGGSSSGRGRLLYTVEPDRKRVGLELLIRLVVSGFVVFLTYYQGRTLVWPTLAAFVIFTLWPLTHLGDGMELYQNGVVYKGELYPVGGQTRITWVGRRGFFLPITWLDISNCQKRIKVSFMKDAQKLFNRAYNGTVE